MFFTTSILLSTTLSTISGNWTAVQRDIIIQLDLENTSLEIKTDSTLGSGDIVDIFLYTSQRRDGDYNVPRVAINFTSTPRYYFHNCGSFWTDFPTNLPAEVDKIWRITVDKTAGIRVKIHCNGVEVLNVLLSDSTCRGYRGYWKKYWSRNFKKIYFRSSDTASDYYRSGQPGN